MSFEELPMPEKEEKISNYIEAVEYLKKEGGAGAKSEPFQDFVKQEENKVKNHIQSLELALHLAVIYYLAGFKDYALESLEEIEETKDYIVEETDLFARLKEIKEKMEANQEIEIEFFND